MLPSKPYHLLALFLGGAILLAACAEQPAIVAPPTIVAQVGAAMPAAPRAPAATTAPLPGATAATAAPLPSATVPPAPTPAPNPTSDPITGAAGLARGAITRRPYAVMIDNHPDAYPQVGLDRAAVVFEALAEFGVTRFMAIYAPGLTPDALRIGPVRSTRLYFAQWASGFHALYAHAGGSPQGLALVESTDQLINLDALHKNDTAFFVRSGDRVAPHNLYTGSDALARAATAHDSSDFAHPDVGFLFKTDAPEAQRPRAQQLGYFFIYKQDSAGWDYDPKTNGYLRLRRDRPARDAATGGQLWTKDVVVMEVRESLIVGDEKGRIEQAVIGSGRARVFMDGAMREATWRKDDAAAPLGFYDDAGAEIRLNAGPVWIVALPSLDNLTVE